MFEELTCLVEPLLKEVSCRGLVYGMCDIGTHCGVVSIDASLEPMLLPFGLSGLVLDDCEPGLQLLPKGRFAFLPDGP